MAADESERVQDYASLLKISRITLNHSVMAQYGVSATYLLKQRLLAEIKNELLFTSKSISEIAYAFSFAEPSHLMRFFKQQTGRTCREFQEEYKNGVYEWEWLIILIVFYVPKEIAKKSIAIKEDIAVTLKKLLGKPADHIVSDTNFEPGRIY